MLLPVADGKGGVVNGGVARYIEAGFRQIANIFEGLLMESWLDVGFEDRQNITSRIGNDPIPELELIEFGNPAFHKSFADNTGSAVDGITYCFFFGLKGVVKHLLKALDAMIIASLSLFRIDGDSGKKFFKSGKRCFKNIDFLLFLEDVVFEDFDGVGFEGLAFVGNDTFN